MLAQNFKTATDLDITNVELDALIKVLGMLERDELVHHQDILRPTVPNGFNMDHTGRQTDCGTIGCILGWCRIVGGQHIFRDGSGFCDVSSKSARVLFMYGRERRRSVTPEQAATALRSYLTTGEPDWETALSSTQEKS